MSKCLEIFNKRTMKIVDLTISDTDLIEQILVILHDCFEEFSPEWLPNAKARREEVNESFSKERSSRVLIDDDRTVLGWVGAIWNDNVWEIHPIAVSPKEQRKGFGKMLVDDITFLAKSNGAVSVWAGTSDETNSTNFSKVDLYRDIATSLENLTAPKSHPINFWLKMGFSIVGVMPDEEGLGKPGIHFAKRIV